MDNYNDTATKEAKLEKKQNLVDDTIKVGKLSQYEIIKRMLDGLVLEIEELKKVLFTDLSVTNESKEKAEKIFQKTAALSKDPYIIYLQAAKAAQKMRAYDKQNEYLQSARSNNPNVILTVELIQAKLRLEENQVIQAITILKKLLEDPSVKKIGQNIKFDFIVFYKHGVTLSSIEVTILMSYVLDSGKN